MTKLKLLGTVIVLDGAVDDGRIGGVDQAVDKAENTCCNLWGPNKKKGIFKGFRNYRFIDLDSMPRSFESI